ncbi:Csr1p KNAG_0B05980 [Huiozyma naganishii CBS 8797]|uniref:CRAL-TRIO domain-containing protein n=1 Tax=Huiozyma naganishii (strain ATCC MYA-139 / BCRC 22969 / CBS 8797 / KCTC 17520 / NBRC 10181 / NCYC 3082 / Yp74L-3) TaxID=1071383 RepID=J7RHL1_HUIN7|nr:hypothetical protein KNAG_0B05980 [Kazachstania naganishii CBS 8797]CCK69028.1 hypothetical protein KNAG_0B05980 [Kazachstania naganishii CBS 8797]
MTTANSVTGDDLATVRTNHSHLSRDQEAALKQVWTYLFHFWKVPVDGTAAFAGSQGQGVSGAHESSSHGKSISSSLWGKLSGSSKPHENDASGHHSGHDVKYSKGLVHPALEGMDAGRMQQEFWQTLRLESPDCHLLRFCRARKFHTNKVMRMVARTFEFYDKRKVNALIDGGEAKIFKENKEPGLMMNFKVQKAVLFGKDNKQRPYILVRPKFHHAADQTETEVEKYALLVIELSRLFMREGSITILFDLTDFSLSNMDYSPVKFIISCFEAHYPECLGALLIHKAPWLFSPIWNIIKTWLDPVVASKIVFTKNIKELSRYIGQQELPVYMEGKNNALDLDHYSPPDGSQDKLLNVKDDNFKKLSTKREQLIEEFKKVTAKWIETTEQAQSSKLWQMKCELGEELCQNYAELDPYIRSRSSYDVQGLLKL